MDPKLPDIGGCEGSTAMLPILRVGVFGVLVDLPYTQRAVSQQSFAVRFHPRVLLVALLRTRMGSGSFY